MNIKDWLKHIDYKWTQFTTSVEFRLNLKKEYDRLNVRCFSGLLKRPDLEWKQDKPIYWANTKEDCLEYRTTMGVYGHGLGGLSPYIWINTLHVTRREAVKTLIHEMSHQFVREVLGRDYSNDREEAHGKLFQSTFKTAYEKR